MSEELKRIIKIGITIPLAVFSTLCLYIGYFGFTYLNQSGLTPENERLTFYNYLLPLLLTIGFIFYFSREQFLSKEIKDARKFNYIIVSIVFISALLAIPWQLKQLKWIFNSYIKHERFDLLEWLPILTAIIFTIGSIIIQIKIYKSKFCFSKSKPLS